MSSQIEQAMPEPKRGGTLRVGLDWEGGKIDPPASPKGFNPGYYSRAEIDLLLDRGRTERAQSR